MEIVVSGVKRKRLESNASTSGCSIDKETDKLLYRPKLNNEYENVVKVFMYKYIDMLQDCTNDLSNANELRYLEWQSHFISELKDRFKKNEDKKELKTFAEKHNSKAFESHLFETIETILELIKNNKTLWFVMFPIKKLIELLEVYNDNAKSCAEAHLE